MQILKSGSFINLENQEKIEQLIFTAKEIAETAAETEGFINQEESNKRFGQEIWEGAEYMCRDFEETRIKDIFIRNFLDRLREIASASERLNNPPENSAIGGQTELADKSRDSKDEFLGFEETAEISGQGSAEPVFTQSEITGNPEIIVQNEISDAEIAERDESRETETAETIDAEIDESGTQSLTDENEVAEAAPIEIDPKSPVVPPEPYQFDKCTVTATIQLLPAGTEKRRVVLSVRTHDFAPQISVVELTGEASPENLLRALEKSFEKYRTDLPVKVLDKLKKERSAVKKQTRKILPYSKPAGETPETAVPATGNPDNGSQGNLFGF